MKIKNNFSLSIIRHLPKCTKDYLVSKICPREFNMLVMDIASSCNAKCPFCARKCLESPPQGFMDEFVFESIFNQVKRSPKIQRISLYAFGEPLLNPNAGKYIRQLSSLKRTLVLSTNSTNLEKFYDELMLLDILQFSIEGCDKQSYEQNRAGLKFEHTISRLKEFDARIRERRLRNLHTPHRFLHCLLTKQTNIQKFIECWGAFVDEIRFSVLGPHLIHNNNDIAEFTYPPNMESDCFKFDMRASTRNCAYIQNAITINSNGDAVMCCSDFDQTIKLGDYKDLKEAFNNKFLHDLHTRMTLGESHRCIGCRVFRDFNKNDVLKYFPELNNLEKSDLAKKYKISIRGLL